MLIVNFSLVSVCFSQEKAAPEVKSVIEDIQIINLLNSLDLTEEQIDFIIQKAEQVEQIREDSLNKIYSRTYEMTDACNTIKDEVEQGKAKLDGVVVKNFIEVKDEIEGARKDAHAEIDDIAAAVEGILEPFQLNALDGYRPCIIPIVSNGRIGQADAGERFIKLLERVKEIPEARFYEISHSIADHILERTKQRLPIGIEFDEQQVRLKILNTFDKVRNMEDVDFQVKKQSIAEDLKAIMLPKREIPRKLKIRKFLLSENIIPILKDRINN